MSDAGSVDVFSRLLVATSSKTEAAFAAAIGISHQAVYNARKKGSIPSTWIFEVAQRFGVSANWLWFGIGPMQLVESTTDESAVQQEPPTGSAEPARCPRCANAEKIADDLRSEMSKERKENRELVQELREVNAENRQLWKENSELRERLARLEERQNAQPVSGVPSTTGNVA